MHCLISASSHEWSKIRVKVIPWGLSNFQVEHIGSGRSLLTKRASRYVSGLKTVATAVFICSDERIMHSEFDDHASWPALAIDAVAVSPHAGCET